MSQIVTGVGHIVAVRKPDSLASLRLYIPSRFVFTLPHTLKRYIC
jgi:hypothetical protein